MNGRRRSHTRLAVETTAGIEQVGGCVQPGRSLGPVRQAALEHAIATGSERIEAVEATVQLKRRTTLSS